MAKIIKFEVEVDDEWTESELEDLMGEFLGSIKEMNSDYIDGSEDISIVDKKDVKSVSDEERKRIIGDLFATGSVEYQVQIRMKDETDKEVPGSIHSASGFME